MTLTKIYDPVNGQMQVAGLMSTKSGSNLKKLIEFQLRLENERGSSPFNVAVIFTDRYDSAATAIGNTYDLPVITRDIDGFYRKRGKLKTDMTVRKEFDAQNVKALQPYEIDALAYAGYMSIATEPLLKILGINVHPADLSIVENDRRKYTGDHAVRDAILAGEKYLRASTHIVEPVVDYGKITMMSSPLEVELGENFNPANSELVQKVADDNQSRLKEAGDWHIFPLTIALISTGRYSQDASGNLYFDNEPIQNGLVLDEAKEKELFKLLLM